MKTVSRFLAPVVVVAAMAIASPAGAGPADSQRLLDQLILPIEPVPTSQTMTQ